ncbi:hypothetical protein ACFFQW_45085 [Umezawaea endophytica]|uniref:Uncharacterized protein n=1 Tax=Umezawaea endophytica TaxID=1654476 RepID=A0A9X2VZ77_9PSEU|nr:hypothetical protein [Umezawaea endophytica]MCS7484674.1 hypothetical protein [Umezawaea endophytica]
MTEPADTAHDGQEDLDVHGMFLIMNLLGGCKGLRLREGMSEYVTIEHGETVDYDDVQRVYARADLLELPVRYSDTVGSDIDVVNQQELVVEFGASTFVVLHNEFADAHGLALPVCRPLPGDADNSRLRRLFEMVTRLSDHPVLNKERHARYLNDLADMAWRSHVRRSVIAALPDLSPDDEGDQRITGAALDTREPIKTAYFGFEDTTWTATTRYTVKNARHDDAVRYVAVTLFGWEV